MFNKKYRFIFILLLFLVQGCQTTDSKILTVKYAQDSYEASWIRNGEPILFEGAKWFPQDGIETFLPDEVILMGTYRDVDFFIDRMDVRPFERIYTKFDKNQFRYFEKKNGHD